MGCWNATCGISNLHIKGGQQVYVIVLEKVPHHERSYTTAFWRPVMLPFLSVYDDYGRGENSHSNIDYILDGLKRQLVELSGDDNTGDVIIAADGFTEGVFYEAVHCGRLYVKNHTIGDPREVDFTMLRVDVVNQILDNYTIEMYVGGGEGTCGHGNNYVGYKWADVVAAAGSFLDQLHVLLMNDEDSGGLSPALKSPFRHAGFASDFIHQLNGGVLNLAAMYIRDLTNYRFSNIVDPMSIITGKLLEGEKDAALVILIDVLCALFIDRFMETTRQCWMPSKHRGSQSQETEPYLVLCTAIEAVLKAEESAEEE